MGVIFDTILAHPSPVSSIQPFLSTESHRSLIRALNDALVQLSHPKFQQYRVEGSDVPFGQDGSFLASVMWSISWRIGRTKTST